MNPKKDRSKLVFGSVIALLCIFFVGGVIIGANSLLEMEGTLVPAENFRAQGVVAPPETAQDVIDIINTSVQSAISAKPKMDCSDNISIGDDLIVSEDASSSINVFAKFIKDSAADEFEATFADLSADFGEGFENKLWIPQLSVGDIESFECSYVYYHCMQCEADTDETFEECSSCGNKNAPQMRYRDEYGITVNIKDGAAALENNFRLRDGKAVTDFIGDKFDSFVKITVPVDFQYKNVKLYVKINRLTGKLLELKYIKDVDVTTRGEFVGDYAYAGASDICLPVNEEVRFGFTWPGVLLSAANLSMGTKGTEALKATLTCDNPLLYEVSWSSSYPSVATVDSDGYVESEKKFGKTIITASFEFQGQTYTDECEVYVKNTVESIDISERRLELKVGQTYAQKVSFKPKDSTVQTVKWYSTDETVASVDAQGVITAKAPGVADVYVVSDDGYFKATCKVEVTE